MRAFFQQRWVAVVICTTVFVVAMGAVRYGLSALKATQDGALIYGVCIPVLVVGLTIAWWVDRRSPH